MYSENALYTALKKIYKKWDWEAKKKTIHYVNVTIKRMQDGKIDMETFLDKYNRLTTILVQEKKMSIEAQGWELFKALLKKWRTKMFDRNENFSYDDIQRFKYNEVLKMALKIERS